MTLHEGIKLINILNKENETNSEEEKAFNIEWIRLIRISISNAINKTYKTKGNGKF